MDVSNALRGRRGFTLLELIVVILVLGILAGLAIIGYSAFTERAQQAAARTDLRQAATAVLAKHVIDSAPNLSRAETLAALDEQPALSVVDELSAASTWQLYGKDHAPAARGDFAVAFDNGPATTATDTDGSRAVLLTYGGGNEFAQVLSLGGAGGSTNAGGGLVAGGQVPNGTTPAAVLADPTIISNGAAAGGGSQPSPTSSSSPSSTPSSAPATVDWTKPYVTNKYFATNGANGDGYGQAVAADGDTLAVGAPMSGTSGTWAGRVYMDTRQSTGWQQVLQLDAPNQSVSNGGFGSSVALQAGTLAVTAPSVGPNGTVYIYTGSGSTWTLAQTITVTGVGSGQIYSVAMDGDTMVVGVSSSGSDGNAVVLTRSGGTWTQAAVLSGTTTDYKFGMAVAISGGTIVVGAAYDLPGHQYAPAGHAYVFTGAGSTWTKQAVLEPSDPTPNSRFAQSLAIDKDTVAVGAQFQPYNGETYEGAVYTYARSGSSWTQTAKLAEPDPSPSYQGWFGYAVAVKGSTLLVGGEGYNQWQGKAFVFTNTSGTWTLSQTFNAPSADVGSWGYFGGAVALNNNGGEALVTASEGNGISGGSGLGWSYKVS